MYNITNSYTVTSILHGNIVATQEFSAKHDAMEWFKKAASDPDWFGAGWRIVLRHRGRVVKEVMA